MIAKQYIDWKSKFRDYKPPEFIPFPNELLEVLNGFKEYIEETYSNFSINISSINPNIKYREISTIYLVDKDLTYNIYEFKFIIDMGKNFILGSFPNCFEKYKTITPEILFHDLQKIEKNYSFLLKKE